MPPQLARRGEGKQTGERDEREITRERGGSWLLTCFRSNEQKDNYKTVDATKKDWNAGGEKAEEYSVGQLPPLTNKILFERVVNSSAKTKRGVQQILYIPLRDDRRDHPDIKAILSPINQSSIVGRS